MVCCAEWKLERRSRTDFSSGVSRSNRSGTREIGLAVEPPGAVLAPRERDLPLGVAAEDQGVGLPGVGDRQQVDPEPAKDRLELGGQPQPDAGAVLRRDGVEVEAGQEDFGSIGVEFQLVHRLEERAQRLAGRAQLGGYARRGRHPRVLAGGQHLLADHHADGGVARVGGRGAVALDQGVEVAQGPSGE